MSSIRKVGQALKSAARTFGPGEYAAAGKPIVCPHCGHTTFAAGEAQLNQALSTLLNLDWLDQTATVLTCTECSQMQWFGKRPTRL